jgi:hypothetical protein
MKNRRWKKDSKRRWIARFKLGRSIPWSIVVEYGFDKIWNNYKFMAHMDAIKIENSGKY